MSSRTVGEHLRSHVLGLVAIFIALTGTAIAGSAGGGDSGGPEASASAATVKKVNRKLAGALRRIAALEAKPAPTIPTIPTTLPPSGPAGGALTGTYPSPGLALGSVGPGQIATGALTGADFFLQGGFGTNFGEIAAGSCAATPPAPVPGLEDSDHVLLTPRNFGDTFTLTVDADPANDTISLVTCNVFGGGGMADPDGTGASHGILVVKAF